MQWAYLALPVGAALALWHVLAHWVRSGIGAHPLDQCQPLGNEVAREINVGPVGKRDDNLREAELGNGAELLQPGQPADGLLVPMQGAALQGELGGVFFVGGQFPPAVGESELFLRRLRPGNVLPGEGFQLLVAAQG